MENKVPSFLLERDASFSYDRGHGKVKSPFIERGIDSVGTVLRTAYVQWETSSKDNCLQEIDARVKILFLFFYIIIVSLKKDVLPEVLIGAFVFILAAISRMNLYSIYKKVLFFGLFFGFLVALPSALNLITEGEIIFPLAHLSKPYSFWIYRIPEEIGITREGALVVVMLTSRVMNSLAISLLVLYSTPFPEIIRGLKILQVPDGFLMVLNLTYKCIFIFAKTVEEMHLAKKSRLAGQISNTEARRWIAGRLAFVFKKTTLRSEEIFKAMQSRGFSDEVKVHGIRNLRAADWVSSLILFFVGILFLWM